MAISFMHRRAAGGSKDRSREYLTFTAVESSVFTWAQRAASGTLEYSLDDGVTWVVIADGESTPTVSAGSKVRWRGNLRPTYSTTDVTTTAGIGTFSSTGNYKCRGNVQSLLFGDAFHGTQLSGNAFRCAYACLFYQDTHLLTAPVLPATTLAGHCYRSMFNGCTSLTQAPELPATTLATYCYSYMFRGCASLTQAPELPATTLVAYCYYSMFYGCTSLTQAPELPATTLATYCYSYMFNGCTSLTYVKCLATDISADNCTYLWLNNVRSGGTFVKAAGMEDWPRTTSGIPASWTVEDEVNA